MTKRTKKNGGKKPVIARLVVTTGAKQVKKAVRASRKKNRKRINKRIVHVPTLKGMSQAVAYYLMNPSGSPAMRLSNAWDGTPTTALTLSNFVSVTSPTIVGTYSSAGIGVSSGQFQAFYFRDPLRSFVYSLYNVAAYSYFAVFGLGNSLGAASNPLPSAASEATNVVPLYYSWNTGAQPHGNSLYCGNDIVSGLEGYVWLDFGATMTVTQSTLTAGDSVEWRAFDGGLDTLVSTVKITSSAGVSYTLAASSVFDATHGAYMRIRYVNGTTPAAAQTLAITVSTSAASDVFAHVPVPSAANHLAQFTSVRVNAVSFLLKNLAAPLYQEGSLQAASFDSSAQWKDFIGNKTLAAENNVRNTYRGALKAGSYSFLHIGDEQDLAFKHYTGINRQSQLVRSCSFPLNSSRFIAISCLTEAIGTNQFPGLDFELCATHSMELQTNDQWYPAAPPTMSTPMMESALSKVKLETQFFENPEHLAKIGAFLGGLGRSFRLHAGKIGGALSVLFPQYSAVFNSLATAIGQ